MLMTFLACSNYSGANSISMRYVYLKECMLSTDTHFKESRGGMGSTFANYNQRIIMKNRWMDFYPSIHPLFVIKIFNSYDHK